MTRRSSGFLHGLTGHPQMHVGGLLPKVCGGIPDILTLLASKPSGYVVSLCFIYSISLIVSTVDHDIVSTCIIVSPQLTVIPVLANSRQPRATHRGTHGLLPTSRASTATSPGPVHLVHLFNFVHRSYNPKEISGSVCGISETRRNVPPDQSCRHRVVLR